MTECEHRATLLVADDEPEIVEMLEEHFAGRGFRVLTAGSGQEALEQAVHGPDLVLLDVGMPRLDGFEVCRRLREPHPTCPILFLDGARGGCRCARGLRRPGPTTTC